MPSRTMRCGASCVMSWPSKAIEPWRGCSRPKIVFIRVDLPAPLGPMMATISSASTRRDTARRISVSPYPAVTASTCNSGILPSQVGFQHGAVIAHGIGGPFRQLAPLAHDDDRITQAHDHVHVVLDQQKGDSALTRQRLDVPDD